jgi:hypothetical protein
LLKAVALLATDSSFLIHQYNLASTSRESFKAENTAA